MRDAEKLLRAEGTRIVNGAGQLVLLRGVGLGSWLLPEGYMWRFGDNGDRPRKIEKLLEQLIGAPEAQLFWYRYYQNYIAEADIRKIAEEGFNSVRVPINARFLTGSIESTDFVPERVELLDQLVAWCRKYNVYVILDLHGAPGGQTGTNIDDSQDNKPELFLEEIHVVRTVEIWRKLAEHYQNEGIIAGYDLLNEPLPEWFSEHYGKVIPVYKRIIQAIREVDALHMIILEGVHWSTDWSIFEERLDDNLMLQFHKYWNNPDGESILQYIEKGNQLNVPIFMGEGGENNKGWYTALFKLLETRGISWNFWTWKKMDTNNSPCSIKKPERWQELVAHVDSNKPLTAEATKRILSEYLENMKFGNCSYHQDVVDSVFSRLPLAIPAIFYDFKGEGISYKTLGESGNCSGYRCFDPIEIRYINTEQQKPNFAHTRGEEPEEHERMYIVLKKGEWVSFEVFIKPEDQDTSWIVAIHGTGMEHAAALLVLTDDKLATVLSADYHVWNDMRFTLNGLFKAGKHQIRLLSGDHPIGIEEIRIDKA